MCRGGASDPPGLTHPASNFPYGGPTSAGGGAR